MNKNTDSDITAPNIIKLRDSEPYKEKEINSKKEQLERLKHRSNATTNRIIKSGLIALFSAILLAPPIKKILHTTLPEEIDFQNVNKEEKSQDSILPEINNDEILANIIALLIGAGFAGYRYRKIFSNELSKSFSNTKLSTDQEIRKIKKEIEELETKINPEPHEENEEKSSPPAAHSLRIALSNLFTETTDHVRKKLNRVLLDESKAEIDNSDSLPEKTSPAKIYKLPPPHPINDYTIAGNLWVGCLKSLRNEKIGV